MKTEKRKIVSPKRPEAEKKVSKTWLAMQKGISIGEIIDMKAVLK